MNPRKKPQLGEVVQPEYVGHGLPPGASTKKLLPPGTSDRTHLASSLLASSLFAQGDRDVPGISYAVGYRLSDMECGGDIVDVYHYDNDAVALAIADISGKGTPAAIHAALIKFGLRAYSSHGLTPEKTMRAMDRLYLENARFEQHESFATVFLGIVDAGRRVLTFANAGHEPVLIVHSEGAPFVLQPTCPLLGVFDDQHHLFRQDSITIEPGMLLVAATDGITEARGADGTLFGMERLSDVVAAHRHESPSAVLDAIIGAAATFAGGDWRDDVGVLVARFMESAPALAG